MHKDHDLMGLMKFLAREDWKEPFHAVLDEHFGPAMDAFDLTHDDIEDLLDDAWAMTLWGCAFEDFLTRDLEPDGRNLVEDYLKRRGWKETPRTKAYMKELRTSVMSLYEVSEIVPGQSLRARDLIRAGEPIVVSERSTTHTLKPWDKIAARIVPQRDGHVFAGGLLPFSSEAATMLLDGIHDSLDKDSLSSPFMDDKLQTAAPLFTLAWLFDVLPKALGEEQPVLQNRDGEEIVFHTVRFPLAIRMTQKEIGTRLDTLQDLRRESETFWNWLGDSPQTRDGKDQGAMSLDVTMDDGRPVLGNIELKERSLLLMVNSAARAARGTAMLQEVLGNRVLTPLTEIQTVDQMRESSQGQPAGASSIPPEIATPIVHAMLDKQYRETLDEPVGMIGDVAPRAAVKTAEGREKVADWLKFLENRSASHNDPTDPMVTYDFGWMWRELGIQDLRQ
ncbi:hypothetical protein [Lichenifustis flavocetrariae]|uniref:DUF2384 domain-containing protein n=1 Tax=Lichenifustis flavocetrariae TaxID=2949735 RepID=A0AA42CMM1_9HYPH|nr:hypothetical protein [Lichenifustis flavocetrariae]MCW6512829.1 hypothetical protein [Lichenifustis flavocetrariae]